MQNVAWPRTIVQNENGMSGEVEGRAQRDAGDDAGQRDRQDEEQRDRLAAEEFRARQRRRGERAEEQRQRASTASATRIESRSAAQMSGRLQATPNQCSVSPGGGNWKLRSSLLNA